MLNSFMIYIYASQFLTVRVYPPPLFLDILGQYNYDYALPVSILSILLQSQSIT